MLRARSDIFSPQKVGRYRLLRYQGHLFFSLDGRGKGQALRTPKRQWEPGPEQDQAAAACHPALRQGGGVAHGIRAGTLLPVLPAVHPARLEADGTWERLAEPGMGPPFAMTSTYRWLVSTQLCLPWSLPGEGDG